MTVSVNGIPVESDGWPSPELAAVRELLRQRAVALGLLAGNADGSAVDEGIERLLAREVAVPEPDEAECRRYYESHKDAFRSGDLVHVRHILFQITPGAPLAAIRARAEQALAELLEEPERFDKMARELSNCPSGKQGGNLGQIGRGDTVPEFEQVLFRLGPTGVVREVVRTRHGFHIVAVDERIYGDVLPFEAVREQVAERLKAATEERALKQYVSVLAGEAEVVGADLDAAPTPLVQ